MGPRERKNVASMQMHRALRFQFHTFPTRDVIHYILFVCSFLILLHFTETKRVTDILLAAI